MRVKKTYIENENRMHFEGKKNATGHGWCGFDASATS
jgi:hypothetical protein